MKVKYLLGVAALALLANGAHAATNLIVNGSFETGDFTGYDVVNLNATSVVGSGFDGYGAEDGSYFAALGNVGTDGVISQTFADTAGTPYSLTFYLSGNGSGYSDFNTSIDGVVVQSITDPVPSQPYTKYTFHFTGTGSDTVSFGETNDPDYDALDNIAVTSGVAAVPEPASWALMVLGVGGVGFGMRRRARVALA